jgi:SAM-dependent methyltransferase
MRVCPACERRFASEGWRCPDCGFEPPEIEGYPAFAPEAALRNNGYDPAYFAEIDGSIEDSFWMKARKELFAWAIVKYLHSDGKLLEIGCATGLVLAFFRRAFPNVTLYGFEIFTQALSCAAKSVPDATFFQADARSIPFENEFDTVAAFDVIEHIDDDRAVLEQMFRVTKPGGGMLVSVPHHPFMWSQRDEFLRHKRRYTRSGLIEKITKAGFRIKRATAFVSVPFPAMIAESLLNRKPKKDYNPLKTLRTPRLPGAMLSGVLTFERKMIKAGVSFPFGGSLLVVAEKPGGRAEPTAEVT